MLADRFQLHSIFICLARHISIGYIFQIVGTRLDTYFSLAVLFVFHLLDFFTSFLAGFPFLFCFLLRITFFQPADIGVIMSQDVKDLCVFRKYLEYK